MNNKYRCANLGAGELLVDGVQIARLVAPEFNLDRRTDVPPRFQILLRILAQPRARQLSGSKRLPPRRPGSVPV